MNSIIKKKLQTKRTLLMGILNVTPDSFSDGGLYLKPKKAVARAREMWRQGADIIDVGGESTRPGAAPVSVETELKRVIPVIKAVRKSLGRRVVLSVDTYKSAIAAAALRAGADLVNSVGGISFDQDLGSVVARYKCPLIIYHIKGRPPTMQKGFLRYRDVVGDIAKFFKEQIKRGERQGIKRNQFILDPGLGFGKTVAQNIEIIKRLSEFRSFRLPLALGISRKSHLGKILQDKLCLKKTPGPTDRLEAGLAETAAAVLNGAKIIRTHDVLETKKFLALWDLFI